MTQENTAKQILSALTSVLPKGKDFIALHEPSFSGNEWSYVKECLDTGWVSSVGKYVDEFEKRLAEYTGVQRAVAVVNGTAALHVCLIVAGVKQFDEVLIPALTFVATANAISYCGATPHFVDCEERTLGLDPFKLEAYLHDISEIRNDECYNKITGRRMKAVIPMHTFGHPVDLDPLLQVCEKYRLTLIEDAAESLGTLYRGSHTGNWGKVSSLSFNGNKVITTGGGGAILTNDESLGKLIKHITTTAKVPHKWEYYHDQVGFNYRLPNINAALGCAQLEQLESFISKKRALTKRYREALFSIKEVQLFEEPEFARSNYWLQTLILSTKSIEVRDEILEITNNSGIMTRPAWTLLHKLPMYFHCPLMDLTVSEELEDKIINIPSSAYLEG